MSGRPTVSDVAQLAGVHRSTAARALNPSTRQMLSPETVQRVLAAARELRYTANSLARGLRTNRSQTVGVLVPDLNNPFFPPIVRGIQEALLPRGYTALIANTDNDPETEQRHYEALISRQVDGFIIASARDDDAALLDAADRGAAVVLVNRTNSKRNFPLVAGDDRAGIKAAVAHLLELGHRNIAHLAGPQGVSTASIRASAFREAMQDSGISPEQSLVIHCDGFSEHGGQQAAEKLLDSSRDAPAVSAIVAANDLIALGVIRALRARGLSCPKDMSVVGFNDMRFADAFSPPLTTVHVPHHQMGTEAARLLLESLDGSPTLAKTLLLPLSLIVRGSTASPRPARRSR